jgi:cysteine desulfurase
MNPTDEKREDMSMEGREVYLDYAATTPVDERVIEAMLPHLRDGWGNPNSLYRKGREAYSTLEDARERVAALIGAEHPNEVIFTAGGTESDNAALIGITTRAKPHGGHVIVSAFEHHAVLEPAHFLEKSGYEVTYLKPRPEGVVDPAGPRSCDA